LFSKIEHLAASRPNDAFEISVSFIEIYNEVVYDLLATDRRLIEEKVLSIHENR